MRMVWGQKYRTRRTERMILSLLCPVLSFIVNKLKSVFNLSSLCPVLFSYWIKTTNLLYIYNQRSKFTSIDLSLHNELNTLVYENILLHYYNQQKYVCRLSENDIYKVRTGFCLGDHLIPILSSCWISYLLSSSCPHQSCPHSNSLILVDLHLSSTIF